MCCVTSHDVTAQRVALRFFIVGSPRFKSCHRDQLCQCISCIIIIIIIVDGLGMWRVWVRRGGRIGSWWGNRREGDHWGDLGEEGWIILGWIPDT